MSKLTLRPMSETEYEAFHSKLVDEYAQVNVEAGNWLDRAGSSVPSAWIYDIEVAKDQRGKGYGRDLLRAAEKETMKHDIGTLGLNEFGTNHVAINLYKSEGYSITQMSMSKKLSE